VGYSVYKGSEEYYLLHWQEVLEFHSVDEARAFLLEIADDPVALASLRDAAMEHAAEAWLSDVDDEQMLNILADLLAAGELRVARAPGVSYASVPRPVEEEVPLPPKAKPAPDRKRTWGETPRADAQDKLAAGEQGGAQAAGESSAGAPGSGKQEAPLSPDSKANAKSAADEEKTWIEIELVDEEDRPVADEAWVITLPNGTKQSGTTDSNGRARVDGIDPGTCQVTFPKLDRDAWEAI